MVDSLSPPYLRPEWVNQIPLTGLGIRWKWWGERMEMEGGSHQAIAAGEVLLLLAWGPVHRTPRGIWEER